MAHTGEKRSFGLSSLRQALVCPARLKNALLSTRIQIITKPCEPLRIIEHFYAMKGCIEMKSGLESCPGMDYH